MAVDAKLTVHTEVEGAEQARNEIKETAKAVEAAKKASEIKPSAPPPKAVEAANKASEYQIVRTSAQPPKVAEAGARARSSLAKARESNIAERKDNEKEAADRAKRHHDQLVEIRRERMRISMAMAIQKARQQALIQKAKEEEAAQEKAAAVAENRSNAVKEGVGEIARSIDITGGALQNVIEKFKTFGAVGAIIGVVVGTFNKLIESIKRSTAEIADINTTGSIEQVATLNMAIREENALVDRRREGIDAFTASVRRAEDAEKALSDSMREHAKAQQLVGVWTEEGRHAIEKQIRLEEIEAAKKEKLRDIDRRQEDNARVIDRADEDISRIKAQDDKRNKLIISLMKEQQDAFGKVDAKRDGSVWRRIQEGYKEALGMVITEDQAKGIADNFQGAIDSLMEESAEATRQIGLAKERRTAAVANSAAFATERETVNTDTDVAKKAVEREDADYKRRVASMNRDRKWELEDMAQSEEDARYDSEDAHDDLRRNYQQKLNAKKARHTEMIQRVSVRQQELTEFLESDDVKGKSEDQLTDMQIAKRRRLEARLREAKGWERSTWQEVSQLEYEGDQREVGFRQKFAQSNRLTQMGLGGDATGYAKDTANNTKQLVAGVNRIIQSFGTKSSRTIVGFSAGGR